MEKTLTELLPILEVDQDCILSKKGDLTVGFEVRKPEIFTLSATDYAKLHATWVRALCCLSPGTVFHMQDWYLQSEWKPIESANDKSPLSQASDQHFNRRTVLEHRCRLFITRRPKGRKTVMTAGSSLLQRNLVPADSLDSRIRQEFFQQMGQLEAILKDGWVELRRLKTEELISEGDRIGIIEEYCQLSTDHGVLRDLDFRNGLHIGDRYCVLYTLADAGQLPSQCSAGNGYAPYSTDRSRLHIGWATGLGPLLNCNHIYNQYIFTEDTPQLLRQLETRRKRMQSLAAYAGENALTEEDIRQFISSTITDQRQIVRAHFNILGWTEDPGGLIDLRNRIHTAIARLGASPHVETVGAAPIWWAGIPGNAADLPMNECLHCHAEHAAAFLIPETNYRPSDSSFGIRLGDRISGRPLHIDISDEPLEEKWIGNRNKFVLGGSGSGKSFFTNHLMRSYYEQGAHIVIVDIGNSYQGLCQYVGGYYFRYSEKDPMRFNPFWQPPGSRPGLEKKDSLKNLLLALWRQGTNGLLPSEYVALSNALNLYYEKVAVGEIGFPCFDSFYVFFREEYRALLAAENIRQQEFDMENFLYVLQPFYKGGEYGYLLNASEQLDLPDQRLIIFELNEIKDHPILFPVVTIIIMEIFVSKLQHLEGIRKVMLIEEAWKAIAREGMSQYIRHLFKTIRKSFGEAIIVTQEIEDILSSPVVKGSILNNSDCKILLDQSKFQNRFDEIQSLLGLSDKDKALVLSVNRSNDPRLRYKEVFIGLGPEHSKVYRTEVSLEEYLTYTTEEKEKLKVQDYTRKYGSLQKGIEVLAAEMREGRS